MKNENELSKFTHLLMGEEWIWMSWNETHTNEKERKKTESHASSVEYEQFMFSQRTKDSFIELFLVIPIEDFGHACACGATLQITK